jgi:hypothetical protein
MLHPPKTTPRILLIVAPSLHHCHRTACHWGLVPPHIQNFRNITRAQMFRGVTAGTPFITFGRDWWADMPDGYDLDQTLTAMQRLGRVRIAQDDDIAACRMYADIPARAAMEARA